MITEQDKQKRNDEKIQNGIRVCEEAIAKAEKYERLKDNKDWQAYLGDLKVLVTLHDNEIRQGITMLVDSPNTGYIKRDDFGKDNYVSSKQDWTDFIARHEIQRAEAVAWIQEPEKILKFAAMAREKLPMLKESLAKANAGENGKS